jgi:ketosteroid isomerase-like protein
MRSIGGTEMSDDNKNVVLTFIDAMGSGDAARAERCLTQDVFTLAKGYSKFAGVRRRDVILETIASFRQDLPTGLRPKILTVTAEGERVIVEFEGDAVTSQGRPYRNQYCMVFSMEGSKIKQVNEYFCTIHAEDVLWPIVAGRVQQ